MGLKNDVYSLARTRFNFVTVAASSSLLLLLLVVETDAAEPVASVVDMKSCSLVRCCWVKEEGGQNASEEARSSTSSELRSVNDVFAMVVRDRWM